MKALYTIVGMRFCGTVELVASMKTGEPLILKRETDNPHDPNAVQVWGRDRHLGYVKATEAVTLAHRMDEKRILSQTANFTAPRWPCVEVEEI